MVGGWKVGSAEDYRIESKHPLRELTNRGRPLFFYIPPDP